MLDIFDPYGKTWWMLLLKGIAAVLFAMVAFAKPNAAIVSMAFLFGIYAMADGIVEIGYSFATRTWGMLAVGFLSMFAGVTAVCYPDVTGYVGIMVIAAWLIVRGIIYIWSSGRIPKKTKRENMIIFGGILSILIGLAIFADPIAGAIATVWLIGGYALLFGVAMIVTAFRVRSEGGELEGAVHQ